MPFCINQIQEQGLDIIQLADTAANSVVQVIPRYGGMLHGFLISANGEAINLIDRYKNENELQQQLFTSFKNAKLSPFACRINNGQYSFEEKNYTLQKRTPAGEAIHGLLYDAPFTVQSQSSNEEQAQLILSFDYNGFDPGYPFPYRCELTYTLQKNNQLTLSTTIYNQHHASIPVVDGWHPYFTTGNLVNDLELQFNAKQIVEFNDVLLPTGRLLPYNDFAIAKKIAERQMDNSFLLDLQQPNPRCVLTDRKKNIRIEIYPEASYPVLQIYIPPDRKSIAIENLSAVPDAFNNYIGLQLLPPNEQQKFSTTICVKVS